MSFNVPPPTPPRRPPGRRSPLDDINPSNSGGGTAVMPPGTVQFLNRMTLAAGGGGVLDFILSTHDMSVLPDGSSALGLQVLAFFVGIVLITIACVLAWIRHSTGGYRSVSDEQAQISRAVGYAGLALCFIAALEVIGAGVPLALGMLGAVLMVVVVAAIPIAFILFLLAVIFGLPLTLLAEALSIPFRRRR